MIKQERYIKAFQDFLETLQGKAYIDVVIHLRDEENRAMNEFLQHQGFDTYNKRMYAVAVANARSFFDKGTRSENMNDAEFFCLQPLAMNLVERGEYGAFSLLDFQSLS
jgi:hypothetical protein